MKLRTYKPKHTHHDEAGIVLMMALMLGLALSTGVSALLINKLKAKRLSSSESYQQMSEAAALNGFNRILALLNNRSDNEYRGFLFTIDNQENTALADNGFNWLSFNDRSQINLEEVCTDTSIGVPNHPIESHAWPTDKVPFDTSNGSMFREYADEYAKGRIKAFYRLRGYSSPSKTGVGEGVFEVEGLVKRISSSGEEQTLARTLLTRSLYVNGSVSSVNDWGVLSAKHLVLGPALIDGPGRILHLINNDEPYRQAQGCSNDVRLLQALGQDDNENDNDDKLELGSRIWPVLNRTLPPSNIYTLNPRIDEYIWSFDDTNNQCGRWWKRSTACIRDKSNNYLREPTNIVRNGNSLRIPSSVICPGHNGDCHIYVEHINFQGNTKLLIENENRPVVLHIELPQGASPSTSGMSGAIKLGQDSQICGVDVGSNLCNNRSEQLVITASSGSSPQNCLPSQQQQLDIQGKSLPSAMVSLPRGSVHLAGDTDLQGMIWAHAFCSNDYKLTLTTKDPSNNQHLSTQAENIWQWKSKGFNGIGRTINQGIVGTGLDIFRQW